MLILSRKVGESIMIDDDIIVTIKEINGNQVRVGIEAPQDVEVHREEIYSRIHGGDELVGRQGRLFRQL